MRMRSSGSERKESSLLKRASRPAAVISRTTSVPISMISSIEYGWLAGRRRNEVAKRTSTPSTPVAMAWRASSRLQRTWGRRRKPCGWAARRRGSASGCGEATRGLGAEEAEIGVGLRRGDRRAELHVVDAERVEGGRDRELLLLREVSERELLALAEGGIDNVELADGVHWVVVLVAS